MSRWDEDKRPDEEIMSEFHDLQLRLFHCKDRRKELTGSCEIGKEDSTMKDLYLELRHLYERNRGRFYDVLIRNDAVGFECFAWQLMLSEESRKRFR